MLCACIIVLKVYTKEEEKASFSSEGKGEAGSDDSHGRSGDSADSASSFFECVVVNSLLSELVFIGSRHTCHVENSSYLEFLIVDNQIGFRVPSVERAGHRTDNLDTRDVPCGEGPFFLAKINRSIFNVCYLIGSGII